MSTPTVSAHTPAGDTGAPDMAAIRQRQQATWASGDYAAIGTTFRPG